MNIEKIKAKDLNGLPEARYAIRCGECDAVTLVLCFSKPRTPALAPLSEIIVMCADCAHVMEAKVS